MKVEIAETTESLIKAYRGKLTLYAPVGENDEILLDSRYWAASQKNAADIKLGDGFSFPFDTDLEYYQRFGLHMSSLMSPKLLLNYVPGNQ